MAACLLAMLVTAPTFDTVVCFNDDAPAADAGAVSAREHGSDHATDAADGCQHGHCHHGTPMFSALAGDEAMPITAQSLNPARSARVAPSLPVAGPDRPPRA